MPPDPKNAPQEPKKRGKGAPLGNQNGLKYKTRKARRKVFKALLEHLRQGHHFDNFPPMSRHTIQRYATEFAEDFDPEQLDEAKREGAKLWLSFFYQASLTGKIMRNPQGGMGPDNVLPGQPSIKALAMIVMNQGFRPDAFAIPVDLRPEQGDEGDDTIRYIDVDGEEHALVPAGPVDNPDWTPGPDDGPEDDNPRPWEPKG